MEHQKEIILDSNIWIGYLNKSDVLHKQCEEIIMQREHDLFLVPEYVVGETVTILKMKESYKRAQQALDIFYQTASVVVLQSEILYDQTRQLFYTLDEKYLSFVDVSLLVLAKTYKVVTLDKRLAAAIKKL